MLLESFFLRLGKFKERNVEQGVLKGLIYIDKFVVNLMN